MALLVHLSLWTLHPPALERVFIPLSSRRVILHLYIQTPLLAPSCYIPAAG